MKDNTLLMLVILGLGSGVQAKYVQPHGHAARIPSNSIVQATCATTGRDINKLADVLCPADCLTNGRSVWGTDVYTDDSAICRAAIHAGKITNDGGQVTVQKTPGQISYRGSTRNRITTNYYGAWHGSFIFFNSASPVTPEPSKETTQRSPVTASFEITARDITGSSADTVTTEQTKEVTPRRPVMASCTTTARDFPGSSADVLCPADCLTNGGSVWGTDVYTDDSSICRAAIHAGEIPKGGGQVSVQKTPGQTSYSGSTRFGVYTNNYGAWSGSFIFRSTTSATPEEITHSPPVTASCTTTARDLIGSSADVLCPAQCLTNGLSVWGTDVYTDDSSICRAAIHAGMIPNEGGQVTVRKTPGQTSYSGSTRNGVSTRNYGPWHGSFIFVITTSPATPESTEGITQRTPVTASCATTARDITGSFTDILCPAWCLVDQTSVWGTDVYTDDSSICRAAIHAGIIPNYGGQVTVQKTPGQIRYNHSTRNGISTNYYGPWPGSFTFVILTSPVSPEPSAGVTQRPPVMASCTTTARDITGSSADVVCPPDCLTNGRSVWGTDVYTDDSSICRAAIHAGKILIDGGQVTVQKTSGEASYSGSTRNGVSTNNYGTWPGSFIFSSTSPMNPEPTKETQWPSVMASCTTTARHLPGSSADVLCPADCLTNGGSVWGTDVYTDDSSICRAAIHARKIPKDGGQVSVQKTPGQISYSGSTRNGITTNNYGAWSGSFIFAVSTSSVTPEPTKGITQRPPVTASCTTTARDIPGSSEDVLCPAGCLTNGRSVWGTDVYTDDSSICRAAIHAGKISNDGGQVTVQKILGQTSYSGSIINGISSNNYGAWSGSFIFVNNTSPMTPEPTKEVTQRSTVQASCSTTARDLQESLLNVQCPPGCLGSEQSVWGTDIYTDDSSICRAAIHCGILTNNGGQIKVKKKPGLLTYKASTYNGVTSSSYGAWPGSFVLHNV